MIILVQLAGQNSEDFLPRNFHKNTFSKIFGNFQKSKNLVKIPRNVLELIGLSPGLYLCIFKGDVLIYMCYYAIGTPKL